MWETSEQAPGLRKEIVNFAILVFEQLLQTKGSSRIGRGGGEDLFLMGHEGRKAKGLRVWGLV